MRNFLHFLILVLNSVIFFPSDDAATRLSLQPCFGAPAAETPTAGDWAYTATRRNKTSPRKCKNIPDRNVQNGNQHGFHQSYYKRARKNNLEENGTRIWKLRNRLFILVKERFVYDNNPIYFPTLFRSCSVPAHKHLSWKPFYNSFAKPVFSPRSTKFYSKRITDLCQPFLLISHSGIIFFLFPFDKLN